MISEWWWNYVIAPIIVIATAGLIGAFANWLRKALNEFQATSANTGVTNEKLDRMDATMKVALCRLDSHETRLDGHDVLFARLDGAGKFQKP